MAVFKFSNVGGFGTYQRYNDFLAGNPVVQLDKGSMFPLGVFTLAAAQANVEFTNIPQTYTHLQIRVLARSNRASTDDNIAIRFNSDTAANYSNHYLRGDGSSASASGAGSTSTISGADITANNATASVFSTHIIDILDYKNTNKAKTIRTLGGYDLNGSGNIRLTSGAWYKNTSSVYEAISTIRLYPATAGDWVTNSSFALYGINA